MSRQVLDRHLKALEMARRGVAAVEIVAACQIEFRSLSTFLRKHGIEPVVRPRPAKPAYHRAGPMPMPKTRCRACGAAPRDPVTRGCAFCDGLARLGIRPA